MTKLIEYYNGLNKYLDEDERKELIKKYNKWVREQPSILDGDVNVGIPHHVRTATNSGTALKPCDLWQVPITYAQHHEHETANPSHQKEFLERLPQLHDRFIQENCLWELFLK